MIKTDQQEYKFRDNEQMGERKRLFCQIESVNQNYPRLVKNDIYLVTLMDFWKNSDRRHLMLPLISRF